MMMNIGDSDGEKEGHEGDISLASIPCGISMKEEFLMS